MANPFHYYVELRNNSGTTLGTHVIAHSSFAAMQLASERNPGYGFFTVVLIVAVFTFAAGWVAFRRKE